MQIRSNPDDSREIYFNKPIEIPKAEIGYVGVANTNDGEKLILAFWMLTTKSRIPCALALSRDQAKDLHAMLTDALNYTAERN